MRSGSLAMQWAALAGVILVLTGLVGFIDNPLVGKASGALVPTNELHNLVHIATGLVALWIAFGTKGLAQANAVIGFGVLYAVVLVATLISADLFGLFAGYSANVAEHVIHGGVAAVSLIVGWMARSSLATA